MKGFILSLLVFAGFLSTASAKDEPSILGTWYLTRSAVPGGEVTIFLKIKKHSVTTVALCNYQDLKMTVKAKTQSQFTDEKLLVIGSNTSEKHKHGYTCTASISGSELEYELLENGTRLRFTEGYKQGLPDAQRVQ